MDNDLITPDILANRWNMSELTLRQWRWRGKGPKYLKLGHSVMYRIQDVLEFEEQIILQNTSQSPGNYSYA